MALKQIWIQSWMKGDHTTLLAITERLLDMEQGLAIDLHGDGPANFLSSLYMYYFM